MRERRREAALNLFDFRKKSRKSSLLRTNFVILFLRSLNIRMIIDSARAGA